MGHWKLSIVIPTALDTIWWYSRAAAVPNRSSSGHLRRCSDADTTNESLSPLDTIWCYSSAVAVQIGPHQVTYDVVATPIRQRTA
eukprot:scaffold12859_cov125-Skeletonema_dohrnii-CCMP3373.AAC.5